MVKSGRRRVSAAAFFGESGNFTLPKRGGRGYNQP